jgi:hypothetical protein
MLIGQQGEERLTPASFCDVDETLNHEVLVRVASNLPRVVVD